MQLQECLCVIVEIIQNMTKSLIALFLVILPGLLIAQNHYKPIDSVGWELPEFSIPENFNPSLDSGAVTYLVAISKTGTIKKISMLSNTFNHDAESKLRDQVKNATLVRKESDSKTIRYKGTLEISIMACKDVK